MEPQVPYISEKAVSQESTLQVGFLSYPKNYFFFFNVGFISKIEI